MADDSQASGIDDDTNLPDRMIDQDQVLHLNELNIANCGSGIPRQTTSLSIPPPNASTSADPSAPC